MVKIGSQLFLARKVRKLSQKELSKLSGVSIVQISRIENNGSIPKHDTLVNLCDALGLKFGVIFTEDELKINREKKVHKGSENLTPFQKQCKPDDEAFE